MILGKDMFTADTFYIKLLLFMRNKRGICASYTSEKIFQSLEAELLRHDVGIVLYFIDITMLNLSSQYRCINSSASSAAYNRR